MNNNKFLKYYLANAAIIACIVVCVYFFLNMLFSNTYSFLAFHRTNDKLKNLIISNENITLQNTLLEIEIDKLKNDPFYIEKIARRQFSMVKPGETVYIFRNN